MWLFVGIEFGHHLVQIGALVLQHLQVNANRIQPGEI